MVQIQGHWLGGSHITVNEYYNILRNDKRIRENNWNNKKNELKNIPKPSISLASRTNEENTLWTEITKLNTELSTLFSEINSLTETWQTSYTTLEAEANDPNIRAIDKALNNIEICLIAVNTVMKITDYNLKIALYNDKINQARDLTEKRWDTAKTRIETYYRNQINSRQDSARNWISEYKLYTPCTHWDFGCNNSQTGDVCERDIGSQWEKESCHSCKGTYKCSAPNCTSIKCRLRGDSINSEVNTFISESNFNNFSIPTASVIGNKPEKNKGLFLEKNSIVSSVQIACCSNIMGGGDNTDYSNNTQSCEINLNKKTEELLIQADRQLISDFLDALDKTGLNDKETFEEFNRNLQNYNETLEQQQEEYNTAINKELELLNSSEDIIMSQQELLEEQYNQGLIDYNTLIEENNKRNEELINAQKEREQLLAQKTELEVSIKKRNTYIYYSGGFILLILIILIILYKYKFSKK